MRRTIPALVFALWSMPALVAQEAPGHVLDFQAIHNSAGGLTTPLGLSGEFGCSATSLGDLDGDGVEDLAVGARLHEGLKGGVWILFMNADGTVKQNRLIAENKSGMGSLLSEGFVGSLFGSSVSTVGDLDGDGVVELAVGAPGAAGTGLVFILFLNSAGLVKKELFLGAYAADFGGLLEFGDSFGESVAGLGDFTGDGIPDLAIGASGDDDGGPNYGAVWLAALDTNGGVKSKTKISASAGDFQADLSTATNFGFGLSALGDVDGDGVGDLAVGAPAEFPPLTHTGNVFTLFLRPDGTVKAHTEIGEGVGGFTPDLNPYGMFGAAVAHLPDLDGDGIDELAVGDPYGVDWADNSSGKVWVLFLNGDGTVRTHIKIDEDYTGGAELGLEDGMRFGSALAWLDDLNDDSRPDLLVGASGFSELGGPAIFASGAAYALLLDSWVEAESSVFGCGINPDGSLSVQSGALAEDDTVVLALDNPLGTQASGSLPVLFIAPKPSQYYPCGQPMPGWSMEGAGAWAELLINHQPLVTLIPPLVGEPWMGPGQPSLFTLPGPTPYSGLSGLTLYAQGFLWDPSAGAGVPFGLTSGLRMTVGSPALTE